MSDLTLRATLSGWSLASLRSVARKFLHFILAVSGVICCPMPPAELAVRLLLLKIENYHEHLDMYLGFTSESFTATQT